MPSEICFTSTAKLLPVEDQQKAARFKNSKQGAWWAYVHLAVRNILGKYAECEGADLLFQYSVNGKPSLSAKHKLKLFFNISHCSNFALLAVSKDTDLGVDVEKVKNIPDMTLVAKHFFSLSEQQYFASIIDDRKQAVFFEIWTQKESLIKANGGGLSLPLDVFDVVEVSTKHWTPIQPRSSRFASTQYSTRALCLTAFGLSESHKAAISIDNHLGKPTPKIKMLSYQQSFHAQCR